MSRKDGVLERETRAYEGALPSLADREGEFAVVVGDGVLGVYPSWEEACKAGYAKVGRSCSFLVRKIERPQNAKPWCLCPICL